MLSEVMVEGEGPADGSLSHDAEARAVNEAEAPSVGGQVGSDSSLVVRRVNPVHVENGKEGGLEDVDSIHADPPLQYGMQLEQHVVGDDQWLVSGHQLLPDPKRGRMLSVSPHNHGQQS